MGDLHMNNKLTNEQNNLILQNERLVYYFINQYNFSKNSYIYEDICSAGKLGLVKAAVSFDNSKNFAFSTYASRCIQNEIVAYLKYQVYRNKNILSIDAINSETGLSLIDKLEDYNSDFTDSLIDELSFIKILNIIFNDLNTKDRILILYFLGNLNQKDICKKFNCSQSYTSRMIRKAIKVIRVKLSNSSKSNIFRVSSLDYGYEIKCPLSHFFNLFNDFNSLHSDISNPFLRITFNKKTVSIFISGTPESFSLLAELFFSEYQRNLQN